MSYPQDYELYKRIDESSGKGKYVTIARFPGRPTIDEVNDEFEGKPSRSKEKKALGLWHVHHLEFNINFEHINLNVRIM
ncbi:hypothetical protein KSP40_PGU015885 [Platanthera guangdongensis]|uniref:Uncharacterized protein n=1 Tax=Platanthera guangdongensis TaxID=2320717 RepID=A0ABR2MYQ4_9ASPA